MLKVLVSTALTGANAYAGLKAVKGQNVPKWFGWVLLGSAAVGAVGIIGYIAVGSEGRAQVNTRL